MTTNKDDFAIRRSLLTGMGAAAAGIAAGSTVANAQESGFTPARHDGDAWMDELPGQHRTWIDTSYGLGGMEALHYANNILNANANVDGGKDSDYAMVLCWRHYATALGYEDPMWEKYGEIFSPVMGLKDPETGEAFKINPANIANGNLDHGGDTIDKMVGRGVQFALCNAATRWYSRYIAGEIGGNAEDIYEEFVAAAIPNSRFIAAGVFGTTRAQEYGYSLLYAG
ncbi:MAG: hypothetical protein ACR2QR_08035 [Woeseiaceae bacterium]